MTKLNLQTVYWLLASYAKKLDFIGLVGLAVLLGCSLFYMTKVLPLNTELNLARQQVADISSGGKVISDTVKIKAPNIADDIEKLNQFFPREKELQQKLGLINIAAAKQQLILNRGDYKLTQTKQAELSRYEIVLPVTGQYTKIRQFISDLLHQQPALALKDVKIKRENTLSPMVEARLVFVLFMHGDSW